MIHRVRVSRILSDMSTVQVFAFRMAGEQEDVDAFGHLLQTRWMEANPGHATVMTTDWPTQEELGQKWATPSAPPYFTFD